MQLLCTFDTGGFDVWKARYDDSAEARRLAGLTQLQMWHDAGDAARVLCLYEVNDRARAEEWIARVRAVAGLVESRFLRISDT